MPRPRKSWRCEKRIGAENGPVGLRHDKSFNPQASSPSEKTPSGGGNRSGPRKLEGWALLIARGPPSAGGSGCPPGASRSPAGADPKNQRGVWERDMLVASWLVRGRWPIRSLRRLITRGNRSFSPVYGAHSVRTPAESRSCFQRLLDADGRSERSPVDAGVIRPGSQHPASLRLRPDHSRRATHSRGTR